MEKFNTITDDDWRRFFKRIREQTNNAISDQIKRKIMPTQNNVGFVELFDEVQKQMNGIAHSKGWYDKPMDDGTRIALMHSELSEALEGMRHGNPLSDKIGHLGFTQVEEELADTIIRIMDLAGERGWRIASAIIAKAEYNKNREYRHGNKNF